MNDKIQISDSESKFHWNTSMLISLHSVVAVFVVHRVEQLGVYGLQSLSRKSLLTEKFAHPGPFYMFSVVLLNVTYFINYISEFDYFKKFQCGVILFINIGNKNSLEVKSIPSPCLYVPIPAS